MKVYKVVEDVNHYQALGPEDSEVIGSYLLDLFQGTPIGETWNAPKVFSLDPRLKEGDFWNFFSGSLCATPEATAKVYTFFEMAGEILPLLYKGREFSVLNITECVDTLDPDHSNWLLTEEGRRIFPTKYVFHDRFAESTLFKIPEGNSITIFVLERDGNPDKEFKAFVEREKMTGLLFELLWEDEA